ncbi:MAG: hypothetical protein FJZ38_07660 [Candidatus Rokubacteria bacterium]|nr:hypothetical protein [Candidatus Rokubacteria bacterium]
MLVWKLLLTPVLIAAASLAGRRWGHAVSGWFVGLPLTSGPVALFLALERGTSFAADAALGALAGAMAEAAFCLAYAYLARGATWPAALAGATIAFTLVAAALQRAVTSWLIAALGAFVTLAIALSLMPRLRAMSAAAPPPRWDVPARMVIATALVLAITESAPVVGARVSGVLATFPVYAAILTVFAHRLGAASAVQVLRGLLWGLFGFVGFFVILGAALEQTGIVFAFVLASGAALAIQAMSFLAARPR